MKPDFVFRKDPLVVFVDGCFWHGCPRHYTRPKARCAFWDAKIEANRARDRRIDRALRAAGWRVLHVWEHALAPQELGRTLARVRRRLAAGCCAPPVGGRGGGYSPPVRLSSRSGGRLRRSRPEDEFRFVVMDLS